VSDQLLRWSRVGVLTLVAALPLGLVSAPSQAAGPVAGGTTVGDSLFPTVGNTGYDAKHYDIALTYRSDETITATTTLEAKAKQKLSSFSVDLEGLTVDRVMVDGRTARFTREATKLTVTPAKAVSGRFSATFSYHGPPVTHKDPDGSKDGWVPAPDHIGATVLSEPVGAMTWFPNNNTPRDKATYDIRVTAPADLEVASNGVLVKRKTTGAVETWSWEQTKPMASYLAMISIGQYKVYRSSMKLTSGKKLPLWSFVDPSLVKETEPFLEFLPEVIRFQEKRYGIYPGTSAGIVVKEIGVGYALETQDRPFFDGAPDRDTIVHEFAHQWYGNSVTPKDWGDIWLNEGFAGYAEDVYDAAHGGPSTAAAFTKTYDENDEKSSLWNPAPVGFTDPADLFGSPVYERGGMTLEALRQEVGTKRFNKILRTWAADKRGKTVTTAQFIALSEKISGRNLDRFFQVWLYLERKPAGY